ncbi:MAG TPA: aspartate--tRNA ligase [Acidimicrobiales bacterium]|nr:aspartate--tRNA ligase [Acidimicrobiales bacterium]
MSDPTRDEAVPGAGQASRPPGDSRDVQVGPFPVGAPLPVGLRTRYCGTVGAGDVGRTVTVCGWVAKRREHGEHLAFLDVRDHTGVVQCVVDGAHALRAEYVVRVTGVVRMRPEGTVNAGLGTGEVELGDCAVETLNPAEPPPFVLDARADVDEAVRLRYRYLDMRTERMQRNLRLRAVVNSAIRRAMERQGFLEVETPLLWTPTPEGAREFAVPSRLQHGSFYVLPQSPQIAKQLTMVGGIDRYYQIARCMRDEDLRADRQFEFTQLDLEASFVGEADVRAFVSEAVADATEAATGERPGGFPEMTWAHAIDTYGSDKPDLRFAMELVDLTPALAGTQFNAFRAPAVRAITVSGGAELGRARLDAFIDRAKSLGAKGLVWMRVAPSDGGAGGSGAAPGPLDLESPVAKFLSPEERAAVVRAAGASAGDLLLVVADERRRACEVLGQLRLDVGRPPVTAGPRRFVWITDFPLFDGVDDDGRPVAAHHPFTMPHPDDLELFETEPLGVRAQSYDLVLNGWELGSGSIRIHRADVQRKVFSALGISDEEAELRFGFLTGAFRYGAPPHGGFAFGVDRLTALLAGEENIREVIAFPKTQSGADLMTGAPSSLSPRQLAELGIRIVGP